MPDSLESMTLLALVFGVAVRVAVGGDQPLWLDETFTGAIAASPDLGAVLYQILQDVNAPLYTLLAHADALLFGLSNAALRLPSLVLGCATPLLCLVPTPGIPRRTALVWCGALALWCPGLIYAQEARCYTLLMALSVALLLSFARLIQDPTRARAFAWACVACLAILTHYYALVLVVCEALVFLAIHRKRALRVWPAAFVFLPVVSWLYIHRGPIMAFSAPEVAWYRTIGVADMANILAYMTGSLVIVALLFGMLAAAIFRFMRGSPREAPGEPRGHIAADWGPPAASCCGAVLVLVLAVVRPSFTLRYLIPFVPGTLLAVALACERMSRLLPLASRGVLAVFLLMAANATTARSSDDKLYNFQAASDWLMEAGVRRVVFFWDHPNNLVENPSQLAIVGGFFFKRRGGDVAVVPFKNVRHRDPRPALLATAAGAGSAILWLYDIDVHDTAAREFPATLEAMDATLRCRDFARPPFGVVACVRRSR